MMPAQRRREHATRRMLERVLATTLLATPLLMNPWGHSLCGRVKEAALWLAAGTAGWLLAVLWTMRPSSSGVSTRFARPAILWLAVTAVTVVTAAAPSSSLWAALSLLPYAVLALAVATVARRSGSRRSLMTVWAASAGLVSVYALFHHYLPDGMSWRFVQPLRQSAGSIGSPAVLGAYLDMALPFAVALTRFRQSPRWLPAAIALIIAALGVTYSLISWAAAAAGVLTMLYAATRASARPVPTIVGRVVLAAAMLAPLAFFQGAWLALPFAGIIAVFLVWWVWRLDAFRTVRPALAAGLVVAAMLFVVDMNRPVVKAGGPLLALSTPRETWTTAMALAMKRPVLGWGPDGFRIGAAAMAQDAVASPPALSFPHVSARSEWYGAAVEGGIAGLCAWLFLVLALASAMVDRSRLEQGLSAEAVHLGKRRDLADETADAPAAHPRRARALAASAVFGAVVAFGIQGMMTPRGPVTALGLALAWGLAATLEIAPARVKRRSLPWAPKLSGPVLRGAAITWTGAAALVALLTLAADTLAGQGDRLVAAHRSMDATGRYRAASDIYPMEPDYRRALGESALDLAGRARGPERLEVAWSAYRAFGGNIAREPGNGAWRAGRALALAHLRPAAALPEATTATRLAPSSALAWWSLACAQRVNEAPRDERAALRRSLENDPTIPEPYLRLAELFRADGDDGRAQYLLGWATKRHPDWAALPAFQDARRAGR